VRVVARLPESEIYLLVRTYFGADDAWQALRELIEAGSEQGFLANVVFVDERRFEGFSIEELEAVHPHRSDGWDVMYVADERAVKESSHPLLVVRVGRPEDLPFRCRADWLHEVDANLSLANLDWDDFRGQIDESGVFGGVDVLAAPARPRIIDPAVQAYESASDELVTISVPPDAVWEICEDLSEAVADWDGVGNMEVVAIAETIIRRINEAPNQQRPEDSAVLTLSAAQWVFIRERAARGQSVRGTSPYRDARDERRRAAGKVIAVIGLRGL
jgi:hypothetical protein